MRAAGVADQLALFAVGPRRLRLCNGNCGRAVQLGIRLVVRFRLDLVGERCLVAATIGIGVAWRLILSIARRSAASQVLAAAMVSGPCRSSTAAHV